MTDYKQLYIGGEWTDPAGSDRFEVVNPATLEVIGSVPEGTEADVDRAVAAARAALEAGPWADSTKAERLEVLKALQAKMVDAADELANLVTAEVGATILFSHFGQIGATNMVLDAYVKVLEDFEFEELRQDVLGPAIVRKEPSASSPGSSRGTCRCSSRCSSSHPRWHRVRRWCSSRRPTPRSPRSASPSWRPRPACPPAC